MGDVKVGVGVVENSARVGVRMDVEHGTNIGVQADVAPLTSQEQRDIATQQRIDDDRLIPNIGDERVMVQQGRIHSPDGETSIATELRFIRRRNKNGGVDVECHIPPLALANETL